MESKDSTVRIKPLSSRVRVEGAKRQYLPFAISWVCDQCGKAHTKKMSEDPGYLSYPVWGRKYEYTLYCDECDNEQTVYLKVEAHISLCP